MVSLTSLWLPILLSAVLVWIASAVVWMFLPHRKKEYAKLPDEDQVMQALRAQSVAPGQYAFPHSDGGARLKDADYQQKLAQGPSGLITVAPPGWGTSMTGAMVLSFLYYIAVGFVVAYLASRTLERGDAYLEVFRVVGTAAWLGYGFGGVSESIWFARPWSSTLKTLIEALAYGALTAGVFAWRWPA